MEKSELIDRLERCIVGFQDGSAAVVGKLNGCKALIAKSDVEDVDVKACTSIINDVQQMVNCLSNRMRDTGGIIRPKMVKWLYPELNDSIPMEYLRGETPWEFFLAYKHQTDFTKAMDAAKVDLAENRLKPLQSQPAIGGFILVHHKKLFRAVIMKLTPSGEKMSVLDVDTHESSFVRSKEAYELPGYIAAFPAQALWCCLNTQDTHLEEMWCQERRTAFKSWLDCNLLTVVVRQKLETVTPTKVVVDLFMSNEESGLEVDFTKWINETVLANMNKAAGLNEDVLAVLEQLDPFRSSAEVSRPARQAEPAVRNLHELENGQPAVNGLVNGFVNQASKVDSWLSDIEQACKVKDKKGSRSAKKKVNPFEEPTFISTRRSPKNSADRNPQPVQNGLNGSRMNPDSREFVPSNVAQVVVSGGDEDDELRDVVADLDLEYQPKDEQRICRMFLKDGVCRRANCRKEHVQRTGRWTDDTAEVCQGPFNHLDLPAEGTETYVKIEHIVSSHMFYVTLHECYSFNDETRESFHENLNSKTNATSPHPLLESIPVMGEYVLAMGIQRSLGPGKKWLRAEVKDVIDESTVEVFFPDFGNKDVVKIRDLRQIRPQFLHLPFQAVLVKLAFLVPVHEKFQEGKRTLEKAIKGKDLRVEIIRRDFANLELDVLLYDEEGNSINLKMIELGFCTSVS